ncbi:MAG: Sir2 family NAD-dependent protein deacetylase [Ginsengibacter sp.]
MRKHLVILTGAGVSAESGLPTFRDSDGLWMGHDVYEVASPDGWRKNPKVVLDFYNHRRRDVEKALPNEAHLAIASLQSYFKVTVITQNIDDLHERAGSKNVLHLHGEIFSMHSEADDTVIYNIRGDIHHGDKAPDGHQLRPHVVWFGEPVPNILRARDMMAEADIFILLGTSLQVYPAAGLIEYLDDNVPKYIVDKNPPFTSAHHNFYPIKNSASAGMKELSDGLVAEYG